MHEQISNLGQFIRTGVLCSFMANEMLMISVETVFVGRYLRINIKSKIQV